MRSPADIRKYLLIVRDRNQLPLSEICRGSRCSRHEFFAALRFEASEDTLRKFDAYIDAPHLHTVKKETKLLFKIERMSEELYREYNCKSPHPRWIQNLPIDKQENILLAMYFRAKCYLAQMMYVETGRVYKIPDGQTYWQWKKKCLRWAKAIRSGDGNSYSFPRPSPVGERRDVHVRKDENSPS